MSQHLRDRLREEMSGQQRPPVDGLVDGAVSRAIRTRRNRRAASGVGTAAVVGITVLAVTMGSQLAPGAAQRSASVDAGSPVRVTVQHQARTAAAAAAKAHAAAKAQAAQTAAQAQAVKRAQASKAQEAAKSKSNAEAKAKALASASAAAGAAPVGTSKVAELGAAKGAAIQAWDAAREAAAKVDPPTWTAAPAGVPATAGGELELFKILTAQYGTLSNTGVTTDDPLHVQAYLHRASGTGMIRMTLSHDTLGYAGDCTPAPAAYKDLFGDVAPSCSHTSDGGYVVVWSNAGNCIETSSVMVVHPDGTAVDFDLATCLQWDGTQNKPSPQILTPGQATAIGSDPRWDLSMQQSLVDAGAQDFLPLANFG